MTKAYSILTAALMVLGIASAAQAQVTVTESLDSAVVVMGSQLKMTVEVNSPADATVQLVNTPEITNREEGFGPYYGTYVVDIASDTIVTDTRRKIVNTYTLQAFDPGLLAIPPVGAIHGGDTVWAELQALKVLEVDVDTIAMVPMPLAGAVSAQNKWHDYIPLWTWWLLLAAAVIVGTLVAVKKLRKRKEIAIMEASKPLPPYELAIGRLEKLRRSGTAVPGQEKQFYTELTEILRQYLHGRFGINAMEMTSGQIVRALRKNPETRLPADQVDAVLKIADFVKFAKEKPLADDNQRALQRATDFVELTKPVPQPEEEADKKDKKTTELI